MTTYYLLQHYWWLIVSLLAGILVFLLFVQGGQSMLLSRKRNENEKILIVNALGRKWEYTFTTLVLFGGAFFASFPLFYSTSFTGAYWVWMLLLFSFVFQAVSYEFQSKPGNIWGKQAFRTFLFLNGLLAPFLIGAAVATFFTGSPFSVNHTNILGLGQNGLTISQWDTKWFGLDALAEPRNWFLGLSVLFLSRTLAALFFINRIDDDILVEKSRKITLYNAIPFLIFFLTFLIWTLVAQGFSINPETKEVYKESMKYLHNFIQMPIVSILFLIGVIAALYGIVQTILKKEFKKGIWFTGGGSIVVVCMLFLLVGYNNTPYYPSSTSLQNSLTIENSSSSEFTLTVMSIVSILVPFVIAYIAYAWRALEKKRLNIEDLTNDGHSY